MGGSFERYLKQLEELRAINIKRVRKTTKGHDYDYKF